jgi:hypothetical protein
MFCESLLHVLVEQCVITRDTAIEALEGVAELTREMAHDNRPMPASTSVALERIIESFAAKD